MLHGANYGASKMFHGANYGSLNIVPGTNYAATDVTATLAAQCTCNCPDFAACYCCTLFFSKTRSGEHALRLLSEISILSWIENEIFQ